MTKKQLQQLIISTLEENLRVLDSAARAAHEAATNEECQPDNKYDTTALEASYIAQGQANRAQEIRVALESFRTLDLQTFNDDSPVRLTALVTLEDEDGLCRRVFLGPHSGGLKIDDGEGGIVVITPQSPLGRGLLGRVVGEEVKSGDGSKTFLITELC
jgi:transcription elongation GreA/GreB family factor